MRRDKVPRFLRLTLDEMLSLAWVMGYEAEVSRLQETIEEAAGEIQESLGVHLCSSEISVDSGVDEAKALTPMFEFKLDVAFPLPECLRKYERSEDWYPDVQDDMEGDSLPAARYCLVTCFDQYGDTCMLQVIVVIRDVFAFDSSEDEAKLHDCVREHAQQKGCTAPFLVVDDRDQVGKAAIAGLDWSEVDVIDYEEYLAKQAQEDKEADQEAKTESQVG